MEETLKNSLEPGETILWTGKVEDFVTRDQTHKKAFTIKMAIAIALVAVLTVVYVAYAVSKHMSINIPILLIAYALAAIGPGNLLADGKRLQKVQYAVTDRRLLTARENVMAVRFDQIHSGAFRKDADGHVSLLLGPGGLKAKPRKWREVALVGRDIADEGEGECLCYGFYAPTDLPGLRAVLKEKLPFLQEQ
ncbi:MAG: hypothetical protein J5927_01300 [Oscillospiraceae bacterium]|nr:hypothetical protein [Oscillospiraceae bacterium]